MAIKQNPVLWASTALLVTYDEHGAIFDHVSPPSCTPDEVPAPPDQTNTGQPFAFDRLGVRVPAILISPWIPKGTVVPVARVFEHASIPATITSWKLPGFPANQRTAREAAAATFLDLLTLDQMRTDGPEFE
jgi:phospholipase C